MPETYRQSIRLSKPLKGVKVSYHGPAPVRGRELPAIEREAYINGQQDAQDVCQQQIMEAREEMRRLQDEVLGGISQRFENLCDEFNAQVPELVMSIVHKVWAGLELEREAVTAIVAETLAELAPQTDALEVCLSPRDAALFRLDASKFEGEYPGMSLVEDATLGSGDVVLRSRFGVIDARIEKKLSRIGDQLKEVHQ